MRARITFEIDRDQIRFLSVDYFEDTHYIGGFTYLSKHLAEFVKYSKNERRYQVTSDLCHPIAREFLKHMTHNAEIVIEYLQKLRKEVAENVCEDR